jgi:O-antigen/teichoic acid export membrane protein
LTQRPGDANLASGDAQGSQQAPAPAAQLGDLKRQAIRGTVWSVSGYAGGQVLRFGSSIVLTRLLLPETYGLSALILTFTATIAMLTDVGLGVSIIRSPRGNDAVFLNTAWTIQVIRGACLFGIACVIAWPMAVFYDQPEVLKLMPVLGLNQLVTSLVSTRLLTHNRYLQLGRPVLIDLGTQAVAIVVQVTWALASPTVWAIVAGICVSTIARTALSHLVLPGIGNRFAWDPVARRELLKFGRWIFVATAFTLLVTQGDRLVLSAFVSLGALGVYAIAGQLSQIANTLVSKLSSTVLFPLYSRIVEEKSSTVRSRLFRVRRSMLLGLLPIPVVFAAFGDQLVRVVYSDQFEEAGWMLQLLSIGTVFDIIGQTISPVVLAQGDSFRHMLIMIGRGSIYLTLMVVGGFLGGIKGVILGIVISQLLTYPMLIFAVRKTGTWMPLLDLAALAYALALGGLFWMVRPELDAVLTYLHGIARQLIHR